MPGTLIAAHRRSSPLIAAHRRSSPLAPSSGRGEKWSDRNGRNLNPIRNTGVTVFSFQHDRLRGLVAWAFCLLAAGTGCSVHTVETNPLPVAAARKAVTGGESGFLNDFGPTGSRDGKGAGWWWRSFQDRELDVLERNALTHNPGVQAAARRIDQANARMVQAGSALFPQVNGTGQFRRSWDLDGSPGDTSSLGLTLDWEIDVWGRIRYRQAARAQETEAAFDDWLAARLLLTASVAEAWFGAIEQRGQLALSADQIEVNKKLLELTQLRFGQGLGSSVDVLQQKQQLQSVEALVPDIKFRIEAFELVLDTLTGRVSGDRRRATTAELPDPPAVPRAGYPSSLLQERPDLRAQRARIVALDNEIGEAIADRLPRFAIGGSVAGAGTAGLDKLIGDAVANLVTPITDGGARRAEVDYRRSRLLEELDDYTELYLDAVREVETALIREKRLAERVQLQEEQLKTTRKLLTESRNRYSQGGITDYLPVLAAVSREQELERDLLTSRRERLSARVALHRTLGGPMVEPEQ